MIIVSVIAPVREDRDIDLQTFPRLHHSPIFIKQSKDLIGFTLGMMIPYTVKNNVESEATLLSKSEHQYFRFKCNDFLAF